MPFVIDDQGSAGHIEGCEPTDFAGGTVGGIEAGAYALGLEEGMDLSAHEAAVGGEFEREQGGIAQHAAEAHAVGGAEIAQTVGNEVFLIEFDRPRHVGAVAVDDVSPGIDAEMGKLAQGAAVLAAERFLAVGEARTAAALCPAVEGNDHDVALIDQGGDNLAHLAEVLVAHGVAVVAEGAEAVAHPVALHHHGGLVTLDARVGNAELVEAAARAGYAVRPEVVGMVVGHTEEVVAGLLEQGGIAGGRAEGIANLGDLLVGLSAVAEGTFEVSGRHIGLPEDGCGINKQLPSLLGRQLHGGECSPHHNISGKRHLERFLQCLCPGGEGCESQEGTEKSLFHGLVFNDSTGSDVAAAVVSLAGVRDFHALVAGVYKGEVLAAGVYIGDDAHVAHRTGVAAAAEEDEVAFLQVLDLCNGGTLGILRTGSAEDAHILLAINEAREAGAVEHVRSGAAERVAGTEVLKCGAHHAFAKAGVVGEFAFALSFGREVGIDRDGGYFLDNSFCRGAGRHLFGHQILCLCAEQAHQAKCHACNILFNNHVNNLFGVREWAAQCASSQHARNSRFGLLRGLFGV